VLISYSYDFCCIRIPKNSSTSLEVSIYDMGFVIPSKGDRCVGIEPSGHKEGIYKDDKLIGHTYVEDGLPSSVRPKVNWDYDKEHVLHLSFNELVEMDLISSDMLCVSTVRNPVDRFKTLASYVNLNNDPNECWDRFKNNKESVFGKWVPYTDPQHSWIGKNSLLFNVENLSDWLLTFSKMKNVDYIKPLHYKKNKDKSRIDLTESRKKDIIEYYEKDFLLWEKAYEKFN
jgi:hypothetical protein